VVRHLVLALALVTIAAPAGAATVEGDPGDASVLFALQARSGTLVPLAGKAPHRFVLTLHGLARTSTWFDDRPARDAGRVTTATLLGAWKALGFRASPPNGAVVLDAGVRTSDTLAVELRLRSSAARTATARFDVRVLRGLDRGLAHLQRKLDRRLPRHFGGVSLFIDNGEFGGSCLMGQPQLFAFTQAIDFTWLPADGRLLSIATYQALYQLYGTAYGGDGVTTFALPKLTPPVAGMSWQICMAGIYPSPPSLPECPVGEVDLWALPAISPSAFRGSNWASADGSYLEISKYPLYATFAGVTGPSDGPIYGAFQTPILTAPPGTMYMVCINGGDPTATTPRDAFVGQVDLVTAYNAAVAGAPAQWVGLPVDRSTGGVFGLATYPALFSLTGDVYGGDGTTTFAVPTIAAPAPGLVYATAVNGIYPPTQ
jgi:microcystin-dependent protein